MSTPLEANTGEHSVADAGGLSARADCRLDNAPELATRLGLSAGVKPARLVLEAYRAWGPSCVEQFRGDFFVVVQDPARQELWAARDRLGMRPGYVCQHGGKMAAAGTEWAAARAADAPTTVDEEALVGMITGRGLGRNRSPYQHVRPVPAGSWTVLGQRGATSQAYHCPALPRAAGRPMDPSKAVDRFREALEVAVGRLVVPGKTAVLASGGLDSSCVAALVAERDPTAILAHASYRGTSDDEDPYFNDLVEATGLQSLTVEPLASDRIGSVRPVAGDRGVWFDPRNAKLQLLVERLQALGITRIISATAADLLLAGTQHEAAHLFSQGQWRAAASWFARGKPSHQSNWLQGLPRRLAIKAFGNAASGSPAGWEILTPKARRLDDRHRLQNANAVDLVLGKGRTAHERSLLWPWLAGNFADAMAQQQRAIGAMRVHDPFADQDVIDAALDLPAELRHLPGWTKSKPILRQAFGPRLPATIRDRQDAGTYDAILDEGLRRALRPLFSRPCASQLVNRGLIPLALASRLSQVQGVLRHPQALPIAAAEAWLVQHQERLTS